MNDANFARKIIKMCPPGTFDSLLIAGSWNLIDQDAHSLLQECLELNIEVHNAGIFCSGALVGGDHYRYSSIPKEVSTKIEIWRGLCDSAGVPLPVAAFAFSSLHNAVTKIVVGVSSARELEELLTWLPSADKVPRSLWKQAADIGLIPSNVFSSKDNL